MDKSPAPAPRRRKKAAAEAGIVVLPPPVPVRRVDADGVGPDAGQVTQNDIAQIAQVSQATVQRVLTGYRHVKPEKRRRVEAALAQTGYRLNTAARAIRTGRRGGIGLMAAYGAIYVPGALLLGIADVLVPEGIHTIYTPAPAERISEQERLRELPTRLGIDGLLLLHPEGVAGGERLADMLVRYRIPAIWVNHRQIADCVFFDDEGDARRAVAALLERGHRRLAYLDLFSQRHYSRVDRLHGFNMGLAAAGLAGEAFGGDGKAPDTVMPRLAAALSRPDRPTAFVCYSAGDSGVAAALARDRGIAVPRDLALISFAPNEQYRAWGGSADVGSAAVRMDYRRLGQLAAREVLAKLADPAALRPPVPIANELDFREGDPLSWLANA